MKRYLLLLMAVFWSITLKSQINEQKITPADLDPGDFFGRYLAIYQNDILVGAHQDDQNGYASGSVYYFSRINSEGDFLEIDKILPEDGDVEEFFGYSIDIDNTFAVIGSHHDSDFGGSSGSAFLLSKNEDFWEIQRKILPVDPKAGDEFGKAVGISGDHISIGCFLDDDRGTNAGSVYIFSLNGGNPEFHSEIYADDAAAYDQFGNHLCIQFDQLIVGVPEKNDHGEKSGCAYIFEKSIENEWIQAAKLLPGDLNPGDEFGQSVHLNNSIVAVGAYKQDIEGEDSGAVYIYQKMVDNWENVQKIKSPDLSEGDHFGNAVFMDKEFLAVGAYFDDDNGSKSGSVYLYKWLDGQFSFITKLISSDGSFGDAFGSSVALDSNYLVVGAYADSDIGFFGGAAYVFDISAITQTTSGDKKPGNFVFPTVFENHISVRLKESSLPASIYLYDQNGSLIQKWSQELKMQTNVLSELDSGWYWLKIKTPDGVDVFPVCKQDL